MHEVRLKKLYEIMLLIRRVEEYIVNVYPTDVIKSPVHLSIGQEWIAVAVCENILPSDFISNTYRGHATYIAKGGNLKEMIAELHGKATGCGGGKAGSMHLVDIENGVIGCSAVVGTTIPVATGWALAQKMDRPIEKPVQNVVVTVFGDGATEEGSFSESLNFAALHKLPQIFICENNGLAIHQPVEKRWAVPNICSKVEALGIPSFKVSSFDIIELADLLLNVYSKVRTPGYGPVFIEVSAYRWLQHVGINDDHCEDYRDESTGALHRENDVLKHLSKEISSSDLEQIEQRVSVKLNEAIEFAEKSQFPTFSDLETFNYA